MKFARDPSNFYAAKLHNSLESDDTDTAGRIILTSTVVRLVFRSVSNLSNNLRSRRIRGTGRKAYPSRGTITLRQLLTQATIVPLIDDLAVFNCPSK